MVDLLVQDDNWKSRRIVCVRRGLSWNVDDCMHFLLLIRARL